VDAVTGGRVIEGAGTPESAWQSWPGLTRLPCMDLDDWVPADARLVVVAPHPDDEILGCGAMLALHAARGGRCLVVAVTDGEASHAGSSVWTPHALAAARCAERMEGLGRIGVPSAGVHRLGLPDGRIAGHVHALTADLEQRLDITDVVVTTWRLDGHPDHDATGEATGQACTRIGCRLLEAPVWMWHWAAPGDPRVPWHRLRGLCIPPHAQTRKRHALNAHTTQLVPAAPGSMPVLGAGVLQRARRQREHFFLYGNGRVQVRPSLAATDRPS
jgi:LmbE family N-acetylglucosaminyl deacetylase